MNRTEKSRELISRLRANGGSCDATAAADALEAVLGQSEVNRRLGDLIDAASALVTTANDARQFGLDATGPLGAADHRETYRGELEQRMASVRVAMIQCCESGDTDKAAVHSRADKILARRALRRNGEP